MVLAPGRDRRCGCGQPQGHGLLSRVGSPALRVMKNLKSAPAFGEIAHRSSIVAPCPLRGIATDSTFPSCEVQNPAPSGGHPHRKHEIQKDRPFQALARRRLDREWMKRDWINRSWINRDFINRDCMSRDGMSRDCSMTILLFSSSMSLDQFPSTEFAGSPEAIKKYHSRAESQR